MTANEQAFKATSKLPLQCDLHIAKPIFYPKNSNSILISTSYDDTNPGVFKYNIDNNSLEMLFKYDNIWYYPETPEQCIDYNNNTLHIIDSKNGSHITIDLKTKTIKTNNKFYCGAHPQTVQVSSIKGDEIHIISDSIEDHFKFDRKENSFTSVNPTNDKFNDVFNAKLLHIKSTNQLMILGGDQDENIYYCNINKQSYEWKLMNNIKMPDFVDKVYYDALVFGD
eukprot:346627_1